MIKLYSDDFVDEAGGVALSVYDKKGDDAPEEAELYASEFPEELFDGFDPFVSEKRVLVSSVEIDRQAVKSITNDSTETTTTVYLITIVDTYHVIATTIDRASGRVMNKKVRVETEARTIMSDSTDKTALKDSDYDPWY